MYLFAVFSATSLPKHLHFLPLPGLPLHNNHTDDLKMYEAPIENRVMDHTVLVLLSEAVLFMLCCIEILVNQYFQVLDNELPLNAD